MENIQAFGLFGNEGEWQKMMVAKNQVAFFDDNGYKGGGPIDISNKWSFLPIRFHTGINAGTIFAEKGFEKALIKGEEIVFLTDEKIQEGPMLITDKWSFLAGWLHG